jgi:hypothetical protein
MRPLKKRCRILPAGGLGVYGIRLDRMIQMGDPPPLNTPQDWGIRGLIKATSAVS